MTDWHTRMEKDLIEQFGGEPIESFGPDGTIDERPVEVRVAKEGDRFRLNRDTHDELVQNDGSYIFDDVADNLPPKEVEANTIDEQFIGGDWHSDRGYEHQFVGVDEIF
jgi:hypothetical protein